MEQQVNLSSLSVMKRQCYYEYGRSRLEASRLVKHKGFKTEGRAMEQ